ncbi:unnamed protein product [Rhizophagus irregularis]|nr:unnamed protein product [Rhizophagus irregularis]
MDPTARKAVNLNVLRRHDQNIVEIIDSSSYVVVYKFDQGAWTKKGVEGTLFVFKRCCTTCVWIYSDESHLVFETKDRERIGKTLLECREIFKTAVTHTQLTLQPPYYSSNTPTSSKGTSSSLYGRPIQIGDLLQQAEINHPTTSNNSRSSTPAYHDTLQYETPKKNHIRRIIPKSIYLKNPPVTSSNNHTLLDGKMLLDMLRPSNTATASPNNYPFNSTYTTTELSRKQAVDASISSLTALEGINHKRILTKSEFTEQYLRLIQSDPSFMDILYENYVVKAQNML